MTEVNKKKSYNSRPTMKQRAAAKKIVENGGNVSKAMRDAGYSKETAKSPAKLLDSKGFIQLMDELGLTDDFIVRALRDDIESKPGNRTQELALAAKMRGRSSEKIDFTTAGEKIEFPTIRIIDERQRDSNS